MRYTTSAFVCVLASILIARVPLRAQAPAPSVVTTADANSVAAQYVDPANGVGIDQLVQLALTRNADLLATRQRPLEAQGLLRQAGFGPNPVLETEFSSGSPTGSPGERAVSIGSGEPNECHVEQQPRVWSLPKFDQRLAQ